MPTPFRIIEESDQWIVVDKPPFLQAHPSKPGGPRTLWDELRGLLAFEIACGGQVSIINRLDRETSGLTLIAKTHAAARYLSMQMQERRIAKEYLAIVWGQPQRESWIESGPLLRQGDRQPSRIYLKQMVHPEGAPAKTRFEVEQRLPVRPGAPEGLGIVRAIPETGRMHQIRVHLARAGHPVIGDKIYGPDEGCYLEFIETGWTPSLANRLLLSRHALHSSSLRLTDSGHEWRSPLPADLADFVDLSFAKEFSRGFQPTP
jgi:23S rRNA pseudouridine1911/1915/1917 synthase